MWCSVVVVVVGVHGGGVCRGVNQSTTDLLIFIKLTNPSSKML